MQRNGVVLVVCAASGTGKTTLVKRLLEEFPCFAYSISCTTRAPRVGEVEGKDYYFLSREDFCQRRDRGYFAEWAEVYGNLYGTPLSSTLEMLHQGKDLLFEIDVQGASQLRLTLAQSTCVFVLPPSLGELEKRLHARATDDEATICRRLANATLEIREAHWFDTWIVNDDLEQAYDQLRATYIAATLKPSLQPLLLRTLITR
ncbi:MAG: guanylate kinase [Desulfovibrionaceae bacterium]